MISASSFLKPQCILWQGVFYGRCFPDSFRERNPCFHCRAEWKTKREARLRAGKERVFASGAVPFARRQKKITAGREIDCRRKNQKSDDVRNADCAYQFRFSWDRIGSGADEGDSGKSRLVQKREKRSDWTLWREIFMSFRMLSSLMKIPSSSFRFAFPTGKSVFRSELKGSPPRSMKKNFRFFKILLKNSVIF